MKEEHKKHGGIHKNPFERNNYYYGKLMTARDFIDEQCYYNEKRWLINRMVSGWGVVCGLDVTWNKETEKVRISQGMAIDCYGREIIVLEPKEEKLIPEEDECRNEAQENITDKLLVCLEYHECRTEAVEFPSLMCDPDHKVKFNRVRDSYKIRIRKGIKTKPQHEGFCPLCEAKSDTTNMPEIHKYLCDKLKEPCPGCEHSCVVLATINLKPIDTEGEDQKNSIRQSYQGDIVSRSEGEDVPVIDQCSRRRLVYNNPLLFDLINCYHGDLPHVIGLSWTHDGDVDWEEFANSITSNSGLKVTFDRNIKEGSINENTFEVFVVTNDININNIWEQIPGEISVDNTNEMTATFKFMGEKSEWRADFIDGGSRVKEIGGKLVIVLKSDFIISHDKPHKALDGNFIGGKLPSGNGTQGGDFVSWFHIGEKEQNQIYHKLNRSKRSPKGKE
ncbi:MAG: hypothetical protein OIN86_10615 [Candidatus Methanoperedens sp.]|nr:hypothetical protein [Candidatus Methanoperedens sp.]CAG0963553.1 hypothetical protein METP1_00847 [Methanosarcinales archaeon]